MYMKKNLQLIITLIIVLAVSVGISYAVDNWSDPTAAAPGSNVPTPITALVPAQVKPGGLSVNTFAAHGDGRLKQQALFNGELRAVDPENENPVFRIGGKNSERSTQYPEGKLINVDTAVSRDVISEGNPDEIGTLGSSTLINNNYNRLCTAKFSGQVIFCSGSGGSGGTASVRVYDSCRPSLLLYALPGVTIIETGVSVFRDENLTIPYDGSKIGGEGQVEYNYDMINNRVLLPSGNQC